MENNFDPRHVAIIMDGNGRWAKERGLPRVEGHRAGARVVRTIVEEARRIGVQYLTIFSFSTENWNRPATEVAALMGLFKRYLASEVSSLVQNGVRLRFIGDRSRVSSSLREVMTSSESATAHCESMVLTVALSYGGRDEIIRGMRRAVAACTSGELTPSSLDEISFRQFLDLPELPDPELLIRTGNEYRISNFLLWQCAYSEIVVSPVHWPDFNPTEFGRCIDQYRQRERRFGLTGEQRKVTNAG